MVHHSELLRSNSDDQGQRFAAPVGNYFNEIDCGITALPCLADRLNLEKCAKIGVFVTVLSVVGFFHGVLLSYFRGTSQIWASHYNIQQESVAWLIYVNEVLVGILALCAAYWGNRIHRASWIGGLTIFLAVAGALLAAPEIYKPFTEIEINNTVAGPALCKENVLQQINSNSTEEEKNHVDTFVIVFIYQALSAMAGISYITHGVTYIDDNISPKHSPGFIGLAIAANEVGKQAGIYFSWTPYFMHVQGIFVSPVWIVIVILTFLVGCLISLFPKSLPNIVLMKSVNSLLNLASGNPSVDEEEAVVDGFFESVWRLLKNKILLINVFALVLMESALINFNIMEKHFNQSKYHISKYNDSGYSSPSLIQFTTNLLKQPMVAVSVITSGMVIAKVKPKAKYLIMWNIIVFVMIALLFISTVFWNCTSGIQNEHKNAITIPFCSSSCGCSLDEPFHPVCVDGKTYFSPCLAGCRNYTEETNIYHDCSCGRIVTRGSCDTENCKLIVALAMVNSITTAGLLATTVVANFVINLRCVASKDKAIALGLELTFLGLIPYLPVRATYHAVAGFFCAIPGKNGCQYFSEYFPIFVSTITIVLMLLGILLEVLLLFLIKRLDLYKTENYLRSSDLELHEVTLSHPSNENIQSNVDSADDEKEHSAFLRNRHASEGRLDIPRPKSKEERISSYLSEGQLVPPLKPPIKLINKTNSKNSANSGLSSDSLYAIANVVGDDHDSDSFSVTSDTKNQDHLPDEKLKGELVETAF